MSVNSIIRWVSTHPVPVLVTASALVAALAAGILVVMGAAGTPAGAPVSFTVDRTLTPTVAQVDPLGDRPRRVGVLAHPDGAAEELVLEEVMLHVRDAADLDAFLARWGGSVIDSFPADADGGRDHLVRVDAGSADPDRLGGAGWPAGDYRVSDERVTRLLALVAAEAAAGVELLVNPLVAPQSIGNGRVWESPDVTDNDGGVGEPENVFEWSYMREGGPLDTGVARAWQLLQAEDRLRRDLRFMVVDGGFARNDDLPPNSTVRKGSWGTANNRDCGAPCPWHGTQVALSGVATAGNRYGVAGPAGPVTSKLIAVQQGLDYWTTMRRTVNMAEEEQPDVVNLSILREVRGDTRHARTWTDRRMSQVRDTGALIVAAAGNDGVAVDAATDAYYLPCQSPHVLCVGGVDRTAAIDDGSNRGRRFDQRSVEIFGPMCVLSLQDPPRADTDGSTDWICGTSFATPFVGGVAALVMAADPDLDADQVRAILLETAHADTDDRGVVRVRRVNALAAVARALAAPPTVIIDAPRAGTEHSVGHWLDLRGTATDVQGRELPISWRSDLTGALAEGSSTSVPPLVAGRHVITAEATDADGVTGAASVTIDVVDTPPEVHIISPPAQAPPILEGSDLNLVATSYDPDTYAPVPDDQALWYVWREGAAVHVAQGHTTTLPAAEVTPGSYLARFVGGTSHVERAFTISALPPGQVPATATITAPADGLELWAPKGNPATVEFTGSGTDGQGAAVPGTRLRWVAHGTHGTTVLCQGTGVPGGAGGAPGGFAVPRDCGSFSAGLGLEDGLAETVWSVWLEVYDSAGTPTPIATTAVAVTVRFVVG